MAAGRDRGVTGKRPPRRRGLSDEERALWHTVTRGAAPLPPKLRRAPEPATEPAADPTPGPSVTPATPPPGRPARAAPPKPAEAGDAAAAESAAEPAPDHPGDPAAGPDARPRVVRPAGAAAPRAPGIDLAAPAVAPAGDPVPGLDRRTAARIRRGTRAPEARIDLHGLTAERAHRALDACIAGALARGQRLVLVITGKGGRSESPGSPFNRPGEGVLRREAPRWLRAGPHARDIVGIFEAHRRHGGAGAFYVYLKKGR